MIFVALAVIAVVVAAVWNARVNDLFCLSVRRGRVLVVRGRVPARFVGDVREVVARAGVRAATIRAVGGDAGARLEFSGDLDGATQQRLRNVFGTQPVSRLREAPPIADPTLGQVLGVAWLAWWLDRSGRG